MHFRGRGSQARFKSIVCGARAAQKHKGMYVVRNDAHSGSDWFAQMLSRPSREALARLPGSRPGLTCWWVGRVR